VPRDRDGVFWRPTCGVSHCPGARCYEYSRFYKCCLLVVFWHWECQAAETIAVLEAKSRISGISLTMLVRRQIRALALEKSMCERSLWSTSEASNPADSWKKRYLLPAVAGGDEKS